MLLGSLLGLAVLLDGGVGNASAARPGIVKFFGGNGTEGGKFRTTGGSNTIAINQDGAGGVSAGDVYVLDRFNHRIQEFTASGEFVLAFGLDVGGPGVDICTVAASCQAGIASEAAGSLGGLEAIAVDQTTGAIYTTGYQGGGISPPSNSRVDVFSATGEFEGAFGWNVKVTGGAEELQFCTIASGCKAGSPGSGPGQLSSMADTRDYLAVSPLNGHVFLGDEGNQRIDEFAPTFEEGKVTGISFVRSFGTGGGVAVDQSGKVYVAGGEQVVTYSPTGNPEGKFVQLPNEFQARSLTDNASNGDVLVYNPLEVIQYGPSGELLETYLEGVSSSVFIEGVAQNEQSEEIYVATFQPESGVFVLGELVPPVTSIEPVDTFSGTSATFEGHVNPMGFFAKYHFEYSIDGVHWKALSSKELPADSNEHAVSEEATGLEAHTHYQLRLVAEKLLKAGSASAETNFDTTAAPPVVSPPSATDVTDTGVRLTATVNPENEATSYRFECVSQAQFEASGYAEAEEIPAGGAVVEAGGEEVEVNQPLSGLAPATAYRCRLAASNATDDTSSSDMSFATYAAQPLGPPDGRVYEQATPVDKNGNDARGGQTRTMVAADGGAVTYTISGGGSAEGGGQHFPIYSAMRSGDSWSSRGVFPDSTFGKAAEVGWSRDVRRDYVVAWQTGEPRTLYEQDLEDGAMTQIVGGLSKGEGIEFAAESSNGAEVLFESEEVLSPDATKGFSNVYLWDRTTHKLSLADLLPSGSQPFHGAFGGPYDWVSGEPIRGGTSAGYHLQDLHALSEDGSTLFFTSYNVNQLYARTGLDTAGPKTVQVSASQKTNGSGVGGKDPKGPKKAVFMEATPDGRYVFFTSQEELTNDATTGTEDQGNDLYRYDTESGELIDIAPDGADVNGAEVQGVIGSSADGSSVYFAANGALTEGASAGDCKSSPPIGWGGGGDCSIYLWHEGEIDLVAPTSGESQHGGELWVPNRGSHGEKSARVSLNGTLLFASGASPTGYDSEGKQELYRYEPGTDLQCVSCNPTGAPPIADALLQSVQAGFSSTGGKSDDLWRNLSANGRRVFFDTPDQLVANDVNGHGGCPQSKGPSSTPVLTCQDVYEWEAKGEGPCESEAQDGGCLFLISSGESNEPSYFGGASENGDDAFFFTRQQLVRQDKDQLLDVYDARVGGGIASQNEEPQPRCEGEACKGAAPPAPGAESAGSASFAGPGNPNPSRHQHNKKARHAKKHKKRHSHKGRKHANKIWRGR